jgi:hypothetical protein
VSPRKLFLQCGNAVTFFIRIRGKTDKKMLSCPAMAVASIEFLSKRFYVRLIWDYVPILIPSFSSNRILNTLTAQILLKPSYYLN